MKIQNGLNNSYRTNPCNSTEHSTFAIKPIDDSDYQQQLGSEMKYERNGIFATSFVRQWYLLTLRVIRCYSRDRSLTQMRPVTHIIIALMIGTLYYGIGDDASMMFNNFRYVFMTLMFLMYTAFCSMAILFPLEMPIVAREHFNRWYSEKAYYFALTFTDFPLQFVCVLLFVLITYIMTGQPFELFRLAFVLIITFELTLISQGIGMIIGAVCGVTVSLCHVSSAFLLTDFMGSLSGWCHSWTVCNCSKFHILWILRTFIRCTAISARVILHFVFEICR